MRRVCDLKQGYTQFGGLRPFGVAFLFAGWDKHHGLQLYSSDPSGNYGGWKARAIGAKSQAATSILKQEWNEDLDLDGALKLALKVLSKVSLQVFSFFFFFFFFFEYDFAHGCVVLLLSKHFFVDFFLFECDFAHGCVVLLLSKHFFNAR